MSEAQFENEVRRLLTEACGSDTVLRQDVDLLETGLLDSLAFITLLDGLEDMGVEIQPTQVEREACLALFEEYRALPGNTPY